MKRHTLSNAQSENNLLLRPSDYPGLNELRAIAVLCVLPGHVEQMKQLNHLPHYYWFPVPGKLGVILFFSLSGFLITALLLKEKYRHQGVSLKTFYIKRALRIWPLYFLLLTLSILVINRVQAFQLPNLSAELYDNLTLKSILLLSFILPNYLTFIIPYASHLWSIGIEEQFYLVQPYIIKVVRQIAVLAGIMLAIVFLNEILNRASAGYFGCIAIGCLGSILCYAQPRFVQKFIHHKVTQIGALVALIAFLAAIKITDNEQVVDFRLHALVFTIIIINAATNSQCICSVTSRPLDYIGRISYGIYMYHLFGIGIAIAVTRSISALSDNRLGFDILLYCLTILLTLGISALSYIYFEGYFLGLKQKLTASAK